jgi:fatty acid desaturase
MGRMTVPVWLQLLIYALAVARVTGLIVADSLTEGIRDSIIDRLDDRPHTAGSYLATLITCPWCAGMWVSLVAAPLVWFFHGSPVMLIPALALAFSQVTGMTASAGR